MSEYSFNSVDSSTKLLLDYFEIANAIWDDMHNTMKYNDQVINAMSVLSDYLCNQRNNLMNKCPKHSITLDELYSEEE